MQKKYNKLKNISDEKFRRATGIKRKTFQVMIDVIEKAEKQRKKKAKGRGRKSKLSIEDQLLMTLEYLREYRTLFHISIDYGIDESRVSIITRRIEDILIKSKNFKLPGKKELLKNDIEFEVVLVDATEGAIERPKKKQKRFYSGKKKAYLKNSGGCKQTR